MRWLWNNLRTLMLALLLAVVVWVVAINEENPLEEKTFPLPVTVELINPPDNLILMSPVVFQASVTLRAPRSVWDSLTADQIHVTANLSGLTAGTHKIPLTAHLADPAIRLKRLDPDAISLTFENRLTREMSARLVQTGEPAPGYEASPPSVTPAMVTLAGPVSAVQRVSEIRLNVSIGELKVDYDSRVTFIPLDDAGQTVTGVTLVPSAAQVRVPITQKQGFRDVTVSPVITGQVASGYRLTNVTVAPLIVTVASSDPRLVSNLPGYVETRPVDISGWNDDRIVRQTLALPPGIMVEGEQSVLIQVSIAAIDYSLTVPREVEFQGLTAGLQAAASPEKVEILLSGPLPVLNRLKREDVRVIIDLSKREVGTYQLTPEVSVLPAEVRVEQVLTSPIEVTISIAPTPTPTPMPNPTPRK